MKKNLILAGVIILILLAVGYEKKKADINEYFSEISSKFSQSKEITADEAKTKIEKLIADSGAKAEVKEVTEESGLYKIMVSFSGQEQPSYLTKDGRKFIQAAIDFDEMEKQKEAAQKQEEETYKPVPKNDKPKVDLYVMSFCPYGNKAEDTIKPVYELLKSKVDFNFHYIVSTEGDKINSLHGEPEVIQNEREACVLKNYGKDKWINFVTYVNTNCGSDGKCWEKGAQSLGISTSSINSCVSSQGVTLMQAEEKASTDAGASGSPTMVINGSQTKAVYQYGNSESYKQTICDAFNNAPSECSKTLGNSSASSAQGGSCGN